MTEVHTVLYRFIQVYRFTGLQVYRFIQVYRFTGFIQVYTVHVERLDIPLKLKLNFKGFARVRFKFRCRIKFRFNNILIISCTQKFK